MGVVCFFKVGEGKQRDDRPSFSVSRARENVLQCLSRERILSWCVSWTFQMSGSIAEVCSEVLQADIPSFLDNCPSLSICAGLVAHSQRKATFCLYYHLRSSV
eukprot:RCo053943